MHKNSNHRQEEKESEENQADRPEKPEGSVPEQVTIAKAEYLQLKDQEKQCQDKMLRIQAEVENIKKRLERDKLEMIRFSTEQIIAELIPFIDDFQRAFAAADRTKDFDVLHKGVEMILNHLLTLLKDQGVSEIPALGKAFDPARHEALMQVETDDHQENTVVEELQKGYMLNNRVLRTAKVKVAKAKESAPITGDEAKENDQNI